MIQFDAVSIPSTAKVLDSFVYFTVRVSNPIYAHFITGPANNIHCWPIIEGLSQNNPLTIFGLALTGGCEPSYSGILVSSVPESLLPDSRNQTVSAS